MISWYFRAAHTECRIFVLGINRVPCVLWRRYIVQGCLISFQHHVASSASNQSFLDVSCFNVASLRSYYLFLPDVILFIHLYGKLPTLLLLFRNQRKYILHFLRILALKCSYGRGRGFLTPTCMFRVRTWYLQQTHLQPTFSTMSKCVPSRSGRKGTNY